MVKRSRVITLVVLVASAFAFGAGCSASSSVGDGPTEADAGKTTTKADAGKKDGSSSVDLGDAGDTEDEDSGTTTKKDAGTKKDAAATDAGDPDTGSVIVIDSGADADAAVPPLDANVVCAPGSVAGFTPAWKAPNALHASACTGTQVDEFVDCMFDPNADPTTCNTFLADAANAGCESCVFTDDAAASYGAIVRSFNGDLFSLNVGGCVGRLAADVTATGCGAKVQAARQCEDAACRPSCPAANDDYFFCTDDATTGVCASFETAADCADALEAPNAAAETCDPAAGLDFIDNAKRYGRLFCTP
jgi:hypothetical protein